MIGEKSLFFRSANGRSWPIPSDIALEPHVGFRGTPDIVPSEAPSASVANDPQQTLGLGWYILL